MLSRIQSKVCVHPLKEAPKHKGSGVSHFTKWSELSQTVGFKSELAALVLCVTVALGLFMFGPFGAAAGSLCGQHLAGAVNLAQSEMRPGAALLGAIPAWRHQGPTLQAQDEGRPLVPYQRDHSCGLNSDSPVF